MGYPKELTHNFMNSLKIQRTLDPGPSQKLYNHSPDGFAWGYEGSGPAQLALALLLDVTNNPELSLRLHQLFKRHFVAAWGGKWQMLSDDILTWIEENIPSPTYERNNT